MECWRFSSAALYMMQNYEILKTFIKENNMFPCEVCNGKPWDSKFLKRKYDLFSETCIQFDENTGYLWTVYACSILQTLSK